MITLSKDGFNLTVNGISTWVPSKDNAPNLDNLSKSVKVDYENALNTWLKAGNVIPQPVPLAITREIDARRLRLALNQMELLSTVEAAIDRSDKATQIEWEYADRVKEDYPLVQSLIAVLKLTPEQVDRVFEIGLGFI